MTSMLLAPTWPRAVGVEEKGRVTPRRCKRVVAWCREGKEVVEVEVEVEVEVVVMGLEQLVKQHAQIQQQQSKPRHHRSRGVVPSSTRGVW